MSESVFLPHLSSNFTFPCKHRIWRLSFEDVSVTRTTHHANKYLSTLVRSQPLLLTRLLLRLKPDLQLRDEVWEDPDFCLFLQVEKLHLGGPAR